MPCSSLAEVGDVAEAPGLTGMLSWTAHIWPTASLRKTSCKTRRAYGHRRLFREAWAVARGTGGFLPKGRARRSARSPSPARLRGEHG